MLLNSKKCSNCEAYYDPTLEKCPECHKSNELYEQRAISNNVVFFHPAAQIGLFLCGFAYAGMLLAELLFSIFVIGVENKIYQSTILLLLVYLLMFGGLLTIAFTTRRKTFIKRFTRYQDYLFGGAYAMGLIFVGLIISFIMAIFQQEGNNTNQSAAIDIANNYPILAFFILCLLGPICEEMTYRVGLYSFFRRINKYLAMAITTIIFALIHFDFLASDMVNELLSLPSYLSAGLLLTIAYEHRGPACSMTAHILYNTFAFVLMILV